MYSGKKGKQDLFGKVNSIYLQGMWGTQVSVEADVSGGLPGWSLWDIWPLRCGRPRTGSGTGHPEPGSGAAAKKGDHQPFPCGSEKGGDGL